MPEGPQGLSVSRLRAVGGIHTRPRLDERRPPQLQDGRSFPGNGRLKLRPSHRRRLRTIVQALGAPRLSDPRGNSADAGAREGPGRPLPPVLRAPGRTRGLPSGLVFLVLVDVNGAPYFELLLKDKFDGAGVWTLSGSIPPGLSGNVMSFKSLGFVVKSCGKRVALSNPEAITFQ